MEAATDEWTSLRRWQGRRECCLQEEGALPAPLC
ncbi:mCG147469 [Mus musculus]|nr:mCG147469 [Mus musculus]